MNAQEEANARQVAMNMQSQETQGEQMRAQNEAAMDQRRAMIRAVLDSEAQERLNRIGLLKPEKQRMLEDIIITNVQRGLIKQKIDEPTLIAMLEKIPGMTSGSSGMGGSSISFKRRAFDDDDDIDI
jgi:programmed cell death protein 5